MRDRADIGGELSGGYYVEPTVFDQVAPKMKIAQEEIFGPVLSVIPANDESHAVDIANDTVYGLNNSVFTNDPDRAYTVARQLRSGTVGQNLFSKRFRNCFWRFQAVRIG